MILSEELVQLAHLMRISADTARQLASLRQQDFTEICALAKRADVIADELEALVLDRRQQATPQENGKARD